MVCKRTVNKKCKQIADVIFFLCKINFTKIFVKMIFFTKKYQKVYRNIPLSRTIISSLGSAPKKANWRSLVNCRTVRTENTKSIIILFAKYFSVTEFFVYIDSNLTNIFAFFRSFFSFSSQK